MFNIAKLVIDIDWESKITSLSILSKQNNFYKNNSYPKVVLNSWCYIGEIARKMLNNNKRR
jgi:hypothetical protein